MACFHRFPTVVYVATNVAQQIDTLKILGLYCDTPLHVVGHTFCSIAITLNELALQNKLQHIM